MKLAECMRAHGLTAFPDPTTSPPPTPPQDGIALFGPGGSFSLPASMLRSPAFKQAAATCGFRLPTSGRTFSEPVAAPGG